MDSLQAKHISYAMQQAFGVDLASEVVVAEANVAALTNKIVEARRFLGPLEGRDEAL